MQHVNKHVGRSIQDQTSNLRQVECSASFFRNVLDFATQQKLLEFEMSKISTLYGDSVTATSKLNQPLSAENVSASSDQQQQIANANTVMREYIKDPDFRFFIEFTAGALSGAVSRTV